MSESPNCVEFLFKKVVNVEHGEGELRIANLDEYSAAGAVDTAVVRYKPFMRAFLGKDERHVKVCYPQDVVYQSSDDATYVREEGSGNDDWLVKVPDSLGKIVAHVSDDEYMNVARVEIGTTIYDDNTSGVVRRLIVMSNGNICERFNRDRIARLKSIKDAPVGKKRKFE